MDVERRGYECTRGGRATRVLACSTRHYVFACTRSAPTRGRAAFSPATNRRRWWPGWNTCARTLRTAGAHVAVIDRAEFPRVKLCAGWLSAAIWKVLGIAPDLSRRPLGVADVPRALSREGVTRSRVAAGSSPVRARRLPVTRLRRRAAPRQRRPAGRADRARWRRRVVDRRAALARTDRRRRHALSGRAMARPRAAQAAGRRARAPVPGRCRRGRADRVGRDGEPELVLFDDSAGTAGTTRRRLDQRRMRTARTNEVRAAWRATRSLLARVGPHPDEPAALADVKGHSDYIVRPGASRARGARRCRWPRRRVLDGRRARARASITAEGICRPRSGRHLGEALVGRPRELRRAAPKRSGTRRLPARACRDGRGACLQRRWPVTMRRELPLARQAMVPGSRGCSRATAARQHCPRCSTACFGCPHDRHRRSGLRSALDARRAAAISSASCSRPRTSRSAAIGHGTCSSTTSGSTSSVSRDGTLGVGESTSTAGGTRRRSTRRSIT